MTTDATVEAPATFADLPRRALPRFPSWWTALGPGQGFIHSFTGPHSLFADTIRSLRALALAHQLGQVLMGEGDRAISLLDRLLEHAEATARFNVYFGTARDAYDVRGRVAYCWWATT